jgi:hypothetical protein
LNGTRTLIAAALLSLLGACADEKTCADFCGDGNVCNSSGACVPLACSPACGAGTACEMGACVPVAAISCAATYPGCAACDTTVATPTWVAQCGSGTTCDASSDTCVSTSTFHAALGAVGGVLHGPFTSGYAVTAACVACHPTAATEVMASQHWTWAGPTPDLVAADLTTIVNPGNIGKVNLINNFCIATASNDKRCDQCHAGYGGDPNPAKPQKSARNYVSADPTTGDSSIPLVNRVDCLVCHSDPTAAYAKDPKTFGNPVSTLNLAAAAQDIRLPTRTNCGACHFYAGGADNVKLMGSALKNPTEAIDVHMGRGMECLDCHAGPSHTFKGAGIHTPAHTQRVGCSDCHGAAPHEGKVATNGAQLDGHVAKIACQVCHIPTFSRGQFGKVDWDWSTAGDKTRGVAGVVTTTVDNNGVYSATGTAVTTYDYIKGSFVWKRNAAPAYRWSNGKSTHALTSDKGDLTAAGLTADDAARIALGEPVGDASDGKIMAYKLMRGRQAVYVDGVDSFVVVPNLFGPAGFWGVIQTVGYTYDPATGNYTAPNAATPVTTPTPLESLLSANFTTGARAAGQIAPAAASLARFDGTTGWDWRYTKLYLDLNHEVAPKAQALGANGACADCHGASPRIPMCELYTGGTAPWGVTCP